MTATASGTDVAAQLRDLLDAGMAAHAVPGVAVGILNGDAQIVVTAGVTHVDAPVRVDDATLFQIGSTTKTLTATVVMRLVERGQLELDAPVHRYVPELDLADRDALERITMRDLLTHMGGHDGDLLDDFGSADDALSRACASMGVLPQLAPLRTVWNYSNAGFTIAGRAIETVTGAPFEQACQELVLDPLGMADSCFSAADAITRRTAVGHRVRDGTPLVTRPWELTRATAPAGGLASSLVDQLRYARFHLGTGPRLLSPDSLRLMQSPLVPAGGGRATACGLSWLLQPTPGLLAHGGETNGQMSSFALVPDRGFAIAVCTNGQLGALVHTPIVKWALRQLARMPASRPAAPPAPSIAPAQVGGAYRARLQTVHVQAGPAGSLLIDYQPTDVQLASFPDAQPVEPHPAELTGGDTLRIAGGPLAGARGEFLRDPAGKVRWLRILGRLHVRAP
ncbi:MAG TPA: serine hydrolase domain-containing protein [Mycobacteriales bacterium]|nr:serine hydrolase domain-containing protein [Mycobacteriales bacterium]